MKKEEVIYPTFVVHSGYTRQLALNSVGQGWSGLINEVFDMLEKTKGVKIIQVKEKYGGLRIYTDFMHMEFDKFIMDIEKRSFTVCEQCGKPGNLREGSWMLTQCDEHAGGKKAIEP